MPLPVGILAAGALGGLLGGGGTQVTQNQTLNASNTNAFNPIITFGGAANFDQDTPARNDFTSSTVSMQTQEQADPMDLLGLLNPLAGAIPPLPPALGPAASLDEDLFGGVESADQAAFPLPLVLGGAALLIGGFFLIQPKESEA